MPLLYPEADSGVADKQQGAVPTMKSSTIIVSREQEAATTADQNVISSSGINPLSELEEILKQKTFTRAEINHLTALLQARTIDEPAGHEEKAHEVLPSKLVLTPARQEELQIVPLQDKLIDRQKMMNNVVNSRVLDEDMASRAELAKAYMGHRPSKVDPAALGLRSQALREDSTPLSILPSPLKSPMLSLVPKSIAYKRGHDNVYMTPRSYGRSAIYSMARAPYSSGSTFSFNLVPATSPSQPVFDNANPVFTFISASSGNNESNMVDSMAEDTVQEATPAVPAFGRAVTPSPIVFGSSGPSGANPFQFSSQPNPATPQNLSSFQASGSIDFIAGGSFTLGGGGGDKRGRKIVKVNRHKRVFTFVSASSGNNESNMVDSMAEDTVQATTPPVPAFGQAVTSSPIVFGSSGPSGANPFQFSSQPPATPQNLSSFQASGSLDFNAGESFSLGTGGGDRAGRYTVKVNRNKQRRK